MSEASAMPGSSHRAASNAVLGARKWLDACQDAEHHVRRRLHLYLLLVVSLVTVSARFTFSSHYERDRREVEKRARDQRTQELLAFWGKLTFAQGQQIPDAFVGRVNWASLHLRKEQREAAMERLRQILVYLCNPSLNE